MVWEGENVVATCRTIIGATNAANADPNTVRGNWAVTGQKNVIHASDGIDAAKREISLWFKANELVNYSDHNEN